MHSCLPRGVLALKLRTGPGDYLGDEGIYETDSVRV